MSIDQHEYGSINPEYFVLVDTNGDRVVGYSFVATDVYLIVDGGTDIDISADCTHVSKGLYKWTPGLSTDPATGALHTSRLVLNVIITDSTGTGGFVDNALIVPTGGHVSAWFNG